MRNQALTLVAVIAVFPATCFAHLGEDHPPGEHSYFPDIPPIEVPVVPYQLDNTTGSWWTDAHHVSTT